MVRVIQEKGAELAGLCARYGVRRLEVFGSAATGEGFDPQASDLDFLVEFQRTDAMNVADQYFGLWEDLMALFGRDVDLVMGRAMRNPHFIEAVNRTRSLVYAAEVA